MFDVNQEDSKLYSSSDFQNVFEVIFVRNISKRYPNNLYVSLGILQPFAFLVYCKLTISTGIFLKKFWRYSFKKFNKKLLNNYKSSKKFLCPLIVT